MSNPVIPNADARRLFLHRHALAERPTHALTHADTLALVRKLGFVQLDSINVVERAHHMILFSRASGYAREVLAALHHDYRALFEQFTHDASILPIEFYPHWHHRFRAMRARLSDPEHLTRLGVEPDKVIARIRRRIRKEGAVSTRDFEDKGEGSWWGWGPSKAALEFLWRAGELAVPRREGFEKFYDFAENVVPADVRKARPTRLQTIDWACREAIARLGFATPSELANFFDLIEISEARDWAKTMLRRKQLIEISVTNADASTKPALALPSIESEIASLPPSQTPARFLSPFDPAIRDRKRALRLFGFDYTIEVFVPEKKRRYGYYVLPILEGERFIGRADLKTHRAERRIEVKGLWPEPDIAFDRHRKDAVDSAVAELCRFTTSRSTEKT